MSDAIAQFAALIDGTGGFRCTVGGHAAREGELLEEFGHAGLVLGDIGIHLGIGAVQVIIGNVEIAAVSGTGEQNQVQIIPLDDTVQVDKYEILPRHRAPVAHDLFLDHVQGQRLAQQRVLQQVQLAGGEIVGRTEPFVHALQQFLRDRAFFRAKDSVVTHGDAPFDLENTVNSGHYSRTAGQKQFQKWDRREASIRQV